MNVLVVGGGGREHALAWKLAGEHDVPSVSCAPGNFGIASVARPIPIAVNDITALADFAQQHAIDLTVVGPELPLDAGIVDLFTSRGLRVFGPSRAAAQLECSKVFAKEFMARHGIPTARYRACSSAADARAIIAAGELGFPVVVKADGLAAGKGVVVAQNAVEAEAAIHAAMDEGHFGDAGARVVLEECMTGPEVSFFALCDGRRAMPLMSAQDHKRIFDDDKGPNTGGMGAYSPAPVMTAEMSRRAMDEIVLPTVRAMKQMGAPFRGILFAGLMITAQGPKLIEYNVRFGDPECQVLMLRMMSDLLPALIAARDGQLRNFDLRWRDSAALVVVMATNGYPGNYGKGSVIGGLDDAAALPGVEIFHAGTKQAGGQITANGGRVLGVSATGASVGEAQQRAYAAVDRIDWPGGFCRRDIGHLAIGRETSNR